MPFLKPITYIYIFIGSNDTILIVSFGPREEVVQLEATGGGLFYAIFFGFDFPGTEKKVAGKWIYRKKSGRFGPRDHLQK